MKRIKPLYALIVCGGKSERMGFEKFRLNYHGVQQWQYLYEELSDLCDGIFISCSTEQSILFPSSLPVIVDDDEYGGCGPMSAVLSAFTNYPSANFIAVGCDYPFLNKADIKILIDAASGYDGCAAAYNKEGLYEPLLAIYRADVAELMKKFFHAGDYSLQYLLNTVDALKVDIREKALYSADTPLQFLTVKQFLMDEKIKNDQLSGIPLK
jgi:molybdenum cofactor guanylyltransferase